MEQELNALELNDTWQIVNLARGKKYIGSKWVYHVKYNPNGKDYRYKACLVAKRLQ